MIDAGYVHVKYIKIEQRYDNFYGESFVILTHEFMCRREMNGTQYTYNYNAICIIYLLFYVLWEPLLNGFTPIVWQKKIITEI